jgi:hypothetical protein
MNNSAYSDVIFIVGARREKVSRLDQPCVHFFKFFCHRVILAARSPVLNALFFVDEYDSGMHSSTEQHIPTTSSSSAVPSTSPSDFKSVDIESNATQFYVHQTRLPLSLELPDVESRTFSDVLGYVSS